MRNLQNNPVDGQAGDDVSANELAARYRAMLSRFEELTGLSSEQGALADSLNHMLADLSMQGGLNAMELAEKRAALAAAIGSLRDLRTEVDDVLDRGECLGWVGGHDNAHTRYPSVDHKFCKDISLLYRSPSWAIESKTFHHPSR